MAVEFRDWSLYGNWRLYGLKLATADFGIEGFNYILFKFCVWDYYCCGWGLAAKSF